MSEKETSQGAAGAMSTLLSAITLLALTLAASPVQAQEAVGRADRGNPEAARLEFRQEFGPVGPVRWMAPESIEKAEYAAGLWAAGNDEQALAAWQQVVATETQAGRLTSPEQAEAAAAWIARLAVAKASRLYEDDGKQGENPLYEEESVRGMQKAAHDIAMNSIRNMR